MAEANLREQLIAKPDNLSGEHISEVLHYVKATYYVAAMQSTTLPDDYDFDNDPSVGFLSADSDFASRAEDILNEGFGRRKL